MPRLTPQEQETLARFAHTLGYNDFLAYDEGEEPDYTRAALAAVALGRMTVSAFFAPLAEDPEFQCLWQENYYRGWRAAEVASYGYAEPTLQEAGEEPER